MADSVKAPKPVQHCVPDNLELEADERQSVQLDGEKATVTSLSARNYVVQPGDSIALIGREEKAELGPAAAWVDDFDARFRHINGMRPGENTLRVGESYCVPNATHLLLLQANQAKNDYWSFADWRESEADVRALQAGEPLQPYAELVRFKKPLEKGHVMTTAMDRRVPAVLDLQRALNAALGTAFEEPLPVIGVYGPKTESAVKMLQRHFGMEESGSFGLQEYEALTSLFVKTDEWAIVDAFEFTGDADALSVEEQNVVLILERLGKDDPERMWALFGVEPRPGQMELNQPAVERIVQEMTEFGLPPTAENLALMRPFSRGEATEVTYGIAYGLVEWLKEMRTMNSLMGSSQAAARQRFTSKFQNHDEALRESFAKASEFENGDVSVALLYAVAMRESGLNTFERSRSDAHGLFGMKSSHMRTLIRSHPELADRLWEMNKDHLTSILSKTEGGKSLLASGNATQSLLIALKNEGDARDFLTNVDNNALLAARNLSRTLRGEISGVSKNDERIAAAVHNAGPTSVQKYGGEPPIHETLEYEWMIGVYLAYAQNNVSSTD